MKHISNIMPLALGFGLLIVALSSTPSHPVAAAGSAPVSVQNTAANPVPVSLLGTGTITGTVNANITNTAVPVGIIGTPSVNIANSPTVSLTTGTSVSDADNPARQFMTASAGDFLTPAGAQGGFPLVPSGKVLVVEYVALRVQPGTGHHVNVRLLVADSTNNNTLDEFNIPLEFQGTNNFYVASQAVRLYVSAGQALTAVAEPLDGDPTGGAFNVSISGHYVNVP